MQLAFRKLVTLCGLSANLGAAGELGTFFHGENLGFDITVDLGFVLELAALGGDFAFYIAVNFDFTCGYVALDFSVLTDGNFTLFGGDFTFDFTVDDHVVGETDRTDDLDSGGEDVGCVSHGEEGKQSGEVLATAKIWSIPAILRCLPESF